MSKVNRHPPETRTAGRLGLIGLGLVILGGLGAVLGNYINSPSLGIPSFAVVGFGVLLGFCGIAYGWLGVGRSVVKRLRGANTEKER